MYPIRLATTRKDFFLKIFGRLGGLFSKYSNHRSHFLKSLPTFAVQFFRKAMYAIVDIAGKQFKVAKDQYIYAPKMDGEAGAAVSFDKVLLTDDGTTVSIGAPTVSGVTVSGKILEHVKSNKVIVFKKKRRKGYAKKNGHRQQFTKVQIDSIG